MNRNYKKLWIMLIEKNMTKTDLRKKAGISTNALAKLGRNESVPLETLEKICKALDCKLEDVLDYEPDDD